MDITKCTNKDCPMKDKCFRFVCPASEWQSYFVGDVREKDGACEYFWKIKNNHHEQKK